MIRVVFPVAALAALFAAGAVRAGDVDKPGMSGKRYPVKADRDITYYEEDRDPHADRHRLDVFRPDGDKRFPVLFFLHGGAWVIGKKDDYFGVYGYGTIARCLAERGMVVVLPNYRLSPAVRHPEHIKDVARAFAWTCKHAADYGGDPAQIFVAGHSAGGHLVSLLATDPQYLQAEGRSPKDIQAVIGISGVYRLDDLDFPVALFPGCMRASKGDAHLLVPIFGTDREVLRTASPIYHVHEGLPPFLLMNAGCDYFPLQHMAKDFAAALREKGCEVETLELAWRTHDTIVFDILHQTAEPKLVEAIVAFVDRHGARKQP